jgi:uncharacterized protein (DUF1697 family)
VPRYVVLLRGINVGGKNTLPMAALKRCLEDLSYTDVSTYINSGNVVLQSRKTARAIEAEIEQVLPQKFRLDSELIKVLALSAAQFRTAVSGRPAGFGDAPDKYHSDAIFLMGGAKVAEAMAAFSPREGVDRVWPGKGVIYHQRLSAKRTKSRLSKVMATPFYKSMTIRNWATTMRLAEMLEA